MGDNTHYNYRINEIDKSENSSQKSEKIPLKDVFFLGDLEKYYKYGTFPYLLFVHVFLIILTTSLIVLNVDDLSLFRLHIRAFDTTFVPQYANMNLGLSSRREFIIPDIGCLNDHIDSALKVIFNFKQSFTHNLTLVNLHNLKMTIHYYPTSYYNHTEYEYDIKNMYDNPFRKYEHNAKLRSKLSQIKFMKIPLEYLMKVNNDRNLNLYWTSDLIYDFRTRGFIKFSTSHEFEFIKNYESLLDYLDKSLIYEYCLVCFLIIILSIVQIVIIIKRFYTSLTTLMEIKRKLEIEGECQDEDSFLEGDNENKLFYSSSKNKWEMLQMNEKRKFFNLWYVLIVLANLFQIVSSVNYILYPILNKINQFLCATSCLLTFCACGYFLEYEDKYYFFYLTIKRSIGTHFKYIVVFILVFFGYGVLLSCTFNYSEKYYSSMQMAFISNFAGLVGDNISTIWSSTFSIDPAKTILFALFYFLTFVAFLMRMMTTITEESFDCVKMKKNYNWLDQKLTVRDYLRHEIGHKDEDGGGNFNEDWKHVHNVDNGYNGDSHHYMMSNALINIILQMEKEKNKIPADLEHMFSLRIAQLKKGGLDDEAISVIVRKELKKLLKESETSNRGVQEEAEESLDLHKIELNLGKTETVKMHFVYELVEGISNTIENSLLKIGDCYQKIRDKNSNINKTKTKTKNKNISDISDISDILDISNNSDSHKTKERILDFSQKILDRLNQIKKII